MDRPTPVEAAEAGVGMEMTIMHDSDRYDFVRDIGSGNFGVARLMRDKLTKELVAIKYIELGKMIDANVKKEIINHRSLRHPNIVRFKEIILIPTHLAIVMEYASGGELFDRICKAGRFTEDEVFMQFVCFSCTYQSARKEFLGCIWLEGKMREIVSWISAICNFILGAHPWLLSSFNNSYMGKYVTVTLNWKTLCWMELQRFI